MPLRGVLRPSRSLPPFVPTAYRLPPTHNATGTVPTDDELLPPAIDLSSTSDDDDYPRAVANQDNSRAHATTDCDSLSSSSDSSSASDDDRPLRVTHNKEVARTVAETHTVSRQPNNAFLGEVRALMKERVDMAMYDEAEVEDMNMVMGILGVPHVSLQAVCVLDVVIEVISACLPRWSRACRPVVTAGFWVEAIGVQWGKDRGVVVGIVPNGLPMDMQIGVMARVAGCSMDTYQIVRIRGADIRCSETCLHGTTMLSGVFDESDIAEWDVVAIIGTRSGISRQSSMTGMVCDKGNARGPDTKKKVKKRKKATMVAPKGEDASTCKEPPKKPRKRSCPASLPRAPAGRDSTRANEVTWLTQDGIKKELRCMDLSTFGPLKIVHINNEEMVRLILIGGYGADLGKADTIRDAIHTMSDIGLDALPAPQEGDVPSSNNIDSISNSMMLVTKKNQSPKWFIIKWAQKSHKSPVVTGVRGNALPATSISNFLVIIDRIVTSILVPDGKRLVCLYPTPCVANL